MSLRHLNTISSECNLSQLPQKLSGDNLKSIEGLKHFEYAHEAAKERSERKHRGHKRKLMLHVDEIDSLEPIQDDYSKDIKNSFRKHVKSKDI